MSRLQRWRRLADGRAAALVRLLGPPLARRGTCGAGQKVLNIDTLRLVWQRHRAGPGVGPRHNACGRSKTVRTATSASYASHFRDAFAKSGRLTQRQRDIGRLRKPAVFDAAGLSGILPAPAGTTCLRLPLALRRQSSRRRLPAVRFSA